MLSASTMTAQRQERYAWRLGIALISLLAGVGVMYPDLAVHASTTQRIVIDRFSGIAIDGFDPVAYFVDRRPVLGLPEHEAWQGGAVWRFRNEGNRASFVAHPEIYGPQFGGYDPVDVARGVTVAGNPLFWLVTGQRLYLFAAEENRDAFAANPEPLLKQATARWPELEGQLAQ